MVVGTSGLRLHLIRHYDTLGRHEYCATMMEPRRLTYFGKRQPCFSAHAGDFGDIGSVDSCDRPQVLVQYKGGNLSPKPHCQT